MPMIDDAQLHRDHVMRLCRAAMPTVAGVVLATEDGGVLGHEQRVADATVLAREALHLRHAAQHLDATAGASALVPRDASMFLVVFVPPALAAEWNISSVPGQDADGLAA